MVSSPDLVNQTKKKKNPEKHNKPKTKICHCAKPETFQRIFFHNFPQEELQFLQFSQVEIKIILTIQNNVAFDPLGDRNKTIYNILK